MLHLSTLNQPSIQLIENASWKALCTKGILDIFLHLTEDVHTHTGATVRIGNKFSRRFSTTSGVPQGCVPAPALFLVAIDWILGHLSPDMGITVGHCHFTDLAYADDAAILMPDQLQVDSVLQSLNAFAALLGLKLSWPKTKLQNVGAGDPPSVILME